MDLRRSIFPPCAVLVIVLLVSLVPSGGMAQATSPGDSAATSAQAGTGKFGHYMVQALVGAGAGWGAGLGLGILGSHTIGEQGGEDPGLEGFILAFPVGFLVGTALGVTLTAKAQGEPRSFLGAALGALAGGGLAIGLAYGLQQSPTVLYVLPFALPATVAVVSNQHFGKRAQLRAGPTLNGQLGVGFSLRF